MARNDINAEWSTDSIQKMYNIVANLDNKLARKLMKEAFIPSMRVLRDDIKRATPMSTAKKSIRKTLRKQGISLTQLNRDTKTTHLKKNVVNKERLKPSVGWYQFHIGFRKEAYWGWFLRKGTKNRKTKYNHPIFGRKRGKISPTTDYVQDIGDKHYDKIAIRARTSLSNQVRTLTQSHS